MRGKIFRGKLRMFYAVKEMEHNLVRMKVAELKKFLQVRGISVANKRCEELLDLSVKALELVIEIID